MPRPRRYEFPGAFYHVYSRGNRREPIFRETTDYEKFELILFEKAQISEIQLWAWCLMPNHFHLLVSTPGANLNIFMRRLLTSYARWFNSRYKLTGHVFESRYKARVCDHDAYLLQLVRYIHMNPVRTRKHPLVRSLEDWKWSSHRFYASRGAPNYVQNFIDLILKRFGEKQVAVTNYRKYLKDRLVVGHGGAFEGLERNGFLGDEIFINGIKNRLGDPATTDKKNESLEKLCWTVAQILKVSVGDLRALNKGRKLSRARQLLMHLAVKYYRFTTTELGRFLNRDQSTISHAIQRMDAYVRSFPELEVLKKELFINK